MRTLVGFIEAGKLKEPIVPFPAKKPANQFVIYIRGEESFRFKRISDLDSLCDAGLLRYRWNRLGNGKLYYVTKAGATAVANNFQSPTAPFGENLSLALLVSTLSGGHIALNGIKDSKTVREVVDDPVLRHTAVTQLIASLQKTAEQLLPWPDFRSYHKRTQQLEQALLIPRPNSTELKTIFEALTTPQTDLTTWPQLWAHLYPLLLIAHLQAGEKS
ncbi:hypothetical protein [Candidatus Leptofilum sp.]|uniref:hypothetical protein n=1 Tax=Candidatus Leptofilum sp. TaxID=3241576 RepID=UPI003B5A80A4